ncbi:hypothetical protein ACIBCH_40300 [Amycolatopsis thailandensis]|uniref:hypothetical protein n=1 Tax=Amycolatopsis thailandensis TaxID=589330 RepID=UPI0037A99183
MYLINGLWNLLDEFLAESIASGPGESTTSTFSGSRSNRGSTLTLRGSAHRHPSGGRACPGSEIGRRGVLVRAEVERLAIERRYPAEER